MAGIRQERQAIGEKSADQLGKKIDQLMAKAHFNRRVSVCRSTSAKVTLPEEFAQEVSASDI